MCWDIQKTWSTTEERGRRLGPNHEEEPFITINTPIRSEHCHYGTRID